MPLHHYVTSVNIKAAASFCPFLWSLPLSVPLKSISVELQIKDHVASVRSCLQYVNEEERPLEAVFVFPLPADAAVCHFSAKIEEQEIVAEVQDRQSVSRRLLWRHSATFLLRIITLGQKFTHPFQNLKK